jgi:ribosomal protein S27E
VSAPDYRQCKLCGHWFMDETYSNEPCTRCATMAKGTNMRERVAKGSGATGGMVTLRSGTWSTVVDNGEAQFKTTQDRIRVNAATGHIEVSVAGGEYMPFRDVPRPAPATGAATEADDMAKLNEMRTRCPKCQQMSVIWRERGGDQNEFCPRCGARLCKAKDGDESAVERPRRGFRLNDGGKDGA